MTHSTTLVVLSLAALTLAAMAPAQALTPLRSPEQRERDAALEAEASRIIQPAAMRCLQPPAAPRPERITIRFFLAQGGTRVSQLQVIESDPPPSPALRRAAFSAVTQCAPYPVHGELRSWGGFWATITLDTAPRAR